MSSTRAHIGQLKVADSATSSEDRGYAYDASWNLINRTNNGSLQSFTVNYENQMSSAPDGNGSYDGNGNLVSAESGVALLAYDAENQLVLVTNDWSLAHPKLTKFIYEGMNRLRIRREYEYVADEEESLVGGGGGQTQQSFPGEGAGMNGAEKVSVNGIVMFRGESTVMGHGLNRGAWALHKTARQSPTSTGRPRALQSSTPSD